MLSRRICLRQHVPALISANRRRDSLYGQQCYPGVSPRVSRQALDRPKLTTLLISCVAILMKIARPIYPITSGSSMYTTATIDHQNAKSIYLFEAVFFSAGSDYLNSLYGTPVGPRRAEASYFTCTYGTGTLHATCFALR